MKRYILVVLILSITISAFATGPSYIYAEINPISVNEKGDILCRTRFLENGMGGHWFQRVEYGLCILSDGKIIEYKTKILDPKNLAPDDSNPDRAKKEVTEEEYNDLQKHWNWVFKTDLNFEKLSKQQQKICNEYGFKENNADKYKVDKLYSIETLEKERNIDLRKQKQLALKNGRSTEYIDTNKVRVLYDFGKTIIFDNDFHEMPEDAGAAFDYKNSLLKNENIGYDYYNITGVLFLD
jgi:hypothetical protein